MNPSGAPSPIERFTSIVTHCTGLDARSNIICPAVNAGNSAPIAGYAKHINERAAASCEGRVNYKLGSPWF